LEYRHKRMTLDTRNLQSKYLKTRLSVQQS
jgi:hypothetical protein